MSGTNGRPSFQNRPLWIGLTVFAAAACRRQEGLSPSPPAPSPTAERREHGAAFLFFFSHGCPECAEVEATVLPEVIDALSIGDPERVDVETSEGLERLLREEERLGFRCDVTAPILIVRGTVLKGLGEMRGFLNQAPSPLRFTSSRASNGGG
ncbi:MAG: hypothetical protein JXP34_20095 [Planctomycetes bacterium]|nr:hypothetical protein [Planctomycetota bacterium]